MEEGLDTGPVIEQESTIINDSDNLDTLSKRLSNISSRLLVKSLKKIKTTIGLSETSRLVKLKAVDQKLLKGNLSYARQLRKEDYLIDWNQKARKLVKKIKGLYPNAYTFYNGKRIKILDAILISDKENSFDFRNIDIESRREIIPGEIVMINKLNGIMIMTNDYPILITCAQLEGKNKTDGYTLSVQSKLRVKNFLGN
tara:strand:- start:803 stop:1399 length:597 start_codon:yes stop_codon:yes gene_type:complete